MDRTYPRFRAKCRGRYEPIDAWYKYKQMAPRVGHPALGKLARHALAIS